MFGSDGLGALQEASPVLKMIIVLASYLVMGWVAIFLAEWTRPFRGVGIVWKPIIIGWVLWTMSGFVDSFFPRGTVPRSKIVPDR